MPRPSPKGLSLSIPFQQHREPLGGKTEQVPFNPPSTEQVQSLLQQYPLRTSTGFFGSRSRWPFFLLLLLLIFLLFTNNALSLIIPWLAIAALFFFMFLRVKTQRTLEARTNQLQELLLLRKHKDALRIAWMLFPELTQQPALHIRTTSIIAATLVELRCHDAALAVMSYLLQIIPANHPHALQIKINRAIAFLMTHQLADADDALRTMRGQHHQQPDNPLTASLNFAELLQAVTTYHWQDGTADNQPGQTDLWIDRFRPLGMDAAYGYALVALCHIKHAETLQHQDPPPAPQTLTHAQTIAQHWWHHATTLLQPQHIIHKFPQLEELAARFAPAPATSAATSPSPAEGRS